MNSLLKEIKSTEVITENQYKNVYAKSPTSLPNCASLNVHKEDNLIRPIVSFIESSPDFIRKYNWENLKPIASVASHRLANTEQLILNLNNLIIPEDFSLLSFDVKNLFMSIPQLPA